MLKAVVVDIDGTLSDSRAREHLAQNKEWDKFHAACELDPPFHDVAGVLRRLDGAYTLVGCTGRPETQRNKTRGWLRRHKIPLDYLLMRRENDYRPDNTIKPELVFDWHRSVCTNDQSVTEHVSFVLEDRDKVVQRWRELGYNCWQVRLGGY